MPSEAENDPKNHSPQPPEKHELAESPGQEIAPGEGREWFLRVMVGWFNQALRFVLLLPRQREAQARPQDIDVGNEMQIRTTTRQLRQAFFALPLLFDGTEKDEAWELLKNICEEAAPFPEGKDAMPQRVALYPRLGTYKANGDETVRISELFHRALQGFSADQLVRMRSKIRPFTQLEDTIENTKIELDTICLLVGLIAALKKEILIKIHEDRRLEHGLDHPFAKLGQASESPIAADQTEVSRAVSARLKRLLGETALQQRQLRPGQPLQLRARTAHERSLNAAYTILRPPGLRIEDDYVDQFFLWAKIRDSKDPQQPLVKIFAERRLADLGALPEEISKPLAVLAPLFELLDVIPTQQPTESSHAHDELEQLMRKTILAMKPFKPMEYYQHPYDHLEEEDDGREVNHEELWWVYFQLRDIFQRGMNDEDRELLRNPGQSDAEKLYQDIKKKLANKTLRDVLGDLFPGVRPGSLIASLVNDEKQPEAVAEVYLRSRFQSWARICQAYFTSIERPDIALILHSFFDGLANTGEEAWEITRLFEHLQNVSVRLKESEEGEDFIMEKMELTWGKMAKITGVEVFERSDKAEEVASLLVGRRELEKKVRSRALARLIRRDDRFTTVPMQVTTITDQEVGHLQKLVEDHPEVRILFEDGNSVFMVTFDAALT